MFFLNLYVVLILQFIYTGVVEVRWLQLKFNKKSDKILNLFPVLTYRVSRWSLGRDMPRK